MAQTIAEALRAEGVVQGELKGKRESLLVLLRQQFGRKVTPAIVAGIKGTSDLATLDEWLAKVLKADTLEELRLPVRKRFSGGQ